VAIILFITIVGFLDPNSFYNIYLQRQEISNLKSEIQDYQVRYRKDTHTLKQLDANPQAMEKIARERYFMKKSNEDIYVFQ
jgi:cell division protein FtsB